MSLIFHGVAIILEVNYFHTVILSRSYEGWIFYLAVADFHRHSIKSESRKDTRIQLVFDKSVILLQGLDLTWKVT